jgi:GcrA cell cycle regulator
MQSFSWAPEHSAALRELVGRGMSYEEAAHAINAKFGTAFTRSAAIGRGKRMGLAAPRRSEDRPIPVPRSQRLPKKNSKKSGRSRKRRADEGTPSLPVVERPKPVRLRCVGIRPRLVALVDLAEGDCRYPYGGDRDGEAITFCGHPRFRGSSYCAPHFHLTRAPAIEAERPAGPVALRLVEAA